MTTWHIYGYGICTDDILERDVKRLGTLIAMAPDYQSCIHEYFARKEIGEPTWDNYMETDVDYELGLPTIMREVIEEDAGIELTACEDFDGKKFLLYEPKYPWTCPYAEKNLTQDAIKALYEKYIRILTDEKIEIDFKSVENGG